METTSTKATKTARRIIRAPEVDARTGLSDSTRRRLIKAGDFPRPVPIGRRAVGWFADEIDDWLDRRAGSRDA